MERDKEPIDKRGWSYNLESGLIPPHPLDTGAPRPTTTPITYLLDAVLTFRRW